MSKHVSFAAMVFQKRFVFVMDKHKPRPRMYKTAGGQQDGDELPLLTCVREFSEELDVEVRPSDEIRRFSISGRGGDHDFIAYLAHIISAENANIVPGEEILVASLLTLPQFLKLLGSEKILPRHKEFLKYWKDFLSMKLLKELESPADPEFEILIYNSKEPGVDLTSLRAGERIFQGRTHKKDGYPIPKGETNWHAHVLPETADQIRNYLIAIDEKDMEKEKEARRQRAFLREKKKPALAELDDDFLYGKKPQKADTQKQTQEIKKTAEEPSCLKNYRPRIWRIYAIKIGSPDLPPVGEKEHCFMVCDSWSDEAKSLRDAPNRFYWDKELISAGLDSKLNGLLQGFLLKDWMNHKSGSLVATILNAPDRRPGFFTYMVEVI